MSDKEKVLFLCTGNSCRSQMAEAFLRELAGDRFEALSAGMEPSEGVHPMAVKVMGEAGIDISGQSPKGIEVYLGRERIRYVVTVCDRAAKTCPTVWPLTPDDARLSWPFDDPAQASGTDEEKMAVFRRVRDEIKARIEAWLGYQE